MNECQGHSFFKCVIIRLSMTIKCPAEYMKQKQIKQNNKNQLSVRLHAVTLAL